MPRYQAFLSHNSADKPAVEALARRLEQAGLSTFLDIWHLVAGEPWQSALEEALDQSATCLVFIGPSGLAPWQNEEMRAAIARRVSDPDRRFRVIPVVLPGAHREQRSKLPTFLVAVTWVEFSHGTLDDDDALHRLKSAIRGKSPGRSPGLELYAGECPYRGLEVFDVADTRFFFGRDDKIDWMLDRLAKDFSTIQENRFLGVVGASGSGKSSLVRAGLIPALQLGQSRNGKSLPGSAEWPVVILRPGAEPLMALALALNAEAAANGAVPDVLAFSDQLLKDPRRLHATIQTALHGAPDHRRFVIVVDQFEELFTQCQDEEARQALIDNLLYAATIRGGRTLVVITMRADFYGKCSRYERLANALSDEQELVPPMAEHDLRAAIEQPARLCGLELQPGLVDLLLQHMRKQPAGALPLLQQTLYMLWERRNGRQLTVQAYREIGEIEGALEVHANEIYENRLKTDEQRDLCRHVLLMLTTPGEGTEDTRRRVPLAQFGLGDEINGVLQELVKGRLITISESDPPQVEVTHEALIRGWQELRQWLDADRESLRMLQQHLDAAETWRQKDRDFSYLLSGSRLLQAEEWRDSHAKELVGLPLVAEFIEAAVTQRNTEQQLRAAEERQRLEMLQNLAKTEGERAAAASRLASSEKAKASQFKTFLWIGAAGLALSIGLAIFALISRDRAVAATQKAQNLEKHANEQARLAKTERDRAQAQEIIAQEQRDNAEKSSRDVHRELSRAEFLQGARERDDHSHLIKAKHHFLRAEQSAIIARDETRTTSMQLAADQLTDSIEWTLVHDRPIVGATFSTDSQKILTWSDDKTARLWDVTQKELLQTFDHTEWVVGAAFNRQGSRILTWSLDETARLWDVTQKEPLWTFSHEGPVMGAVFNREESRILTWSGDNTTRLWDVTQKELLQTFTHEGRVVGAVFNRDESRILTWSADKTACLWDVTQAEPLRTFSHAAPLMGAVFNREESRILTWSHDKTVRLWDVMQKEPLRTFTHEGVVRGAVFNRDESRILTWSDDKTARLWDVTQEESLQTFTHGDVVLGAVFNRDGSQILTWSLDKTARLWDMKQKKLLLTFKHSNTVLGAVFNRDESRILTWSFDKTARLWDVTQMKLLQTFNHENWVVGAMFNRDESRILTWSEDKTARLWDVTQSELPQTFNHDNWVGGAMFNRDESRILTWSEDKTARLWDVTQSELLRTFSHEASVQGAVFSCDESRALTWSDDKTARLWDVTQREPLRTFSHEAPVRGAVFNREGSRVLTWSEGKTARLWDVTQKEPILTFTHEGRVVRAVFNRDESRILTWSEDKTARLWGVTQKKLLRTFTHDDTVVGAVFNGEESRILTWSGDYSARLWDVTQKEPILTFYHWDWVMGAVFNRDESRILTWSSDKTARLWDVTQKEPVQTFTHEDRVRGAVFNRDESRVLTWSDDKTARLWDVTQKELLQTFDHTEWVVGAAFNRQGSRILTWSLDETARLWDVTQKEPLWTFSHEGPVMGAVFNREESRILTWSGDNTTRLWKSRTENSIPLSQRISEFEVRSGTRMAASGNVYVMSTEEWETRRKALRNPSASEAKQSSPRFELPSASKK